MAEVVTKSALKARSNASENERAAVCNIQEIMDITAHTDYVQHEPEVMGYLENIRDIYQDLHTNSSGESGRFGKIFTVQMKLQCFLRSPSRSRWESNSKTMVQMQLSPGGANSRLENNPCRGNERRDVRWKDNARRGSEKSRQADSGIRSETWQPKKKLSCPYGRSPRYLPYVHIGGDRRSPRASSTRHWIHLDSIRFGLTMDTLRKEGGRTSRGWRAYSGLRSAALDPHGERISRQASASSLSLSASPLPSSVAEGGGDAPRAAGGDIHADGGHGVDGEQGKGRNSDTEGTNRRRGDFAPACAYDIAHPIHPCSRPPNPAYSTLHRVFASPPPHFPIERSQFPPVNALHVRVRILRSSLKGGRGGTHHARYGLHARRAACCTTKSAGAGVSALVVGASSSTDSAEVRQTAPETGGASAARRTTGGVTVCRAGSRRARDAGRM
ncbi:hypothetical protein C8R44DRAFT_746449 [Mycena epipterygia]|nr:hypothetical protein C8R44DRAFT_746449 [Mycena epipterygia]